MAPQESPFQESTVHGCTVFPEINSNVKEGVPMKNKKSGLVVKSTVKGGVITYNHNKSGLVLR